MLEKIKIDNFQTIPDLGLTEHGFIYQDFLLHQENISKIVLDQKKGFFFSCSQSSTRNLFRTKLSTKLQPREQSLEFVGHTQPVLDMVLSEEGELLYSCSKDKTLRTWSSHTGM